jgi:hypothetical protein
MEATGIVFDAGDGVSRAGDSGDKHLDYLIITLSNVHIARPIGKKR